MSIYTTIAEHTPKPVKKVRQMLMRASSTRREAAREATRRSFDRIFEPLKDLPELIRRNTCVSVLRASTPAGDFAFDARDTVIGWSLAVKGAWEPRDTAILSGLVRTGDTVIDVGANLGWYTVHFARSAGGAGKVLAVEPDPTNYSLLVENVRRNFGEGCVVPLRSALLDFSGTVEFELSPGNYGDHRVRFADRKPDDVADLYSEGTRKVIKVNAITLDQLSAISRDDEPHFRIRLLKLDCQGSEAAVIRGGLDTLRRSTFVATEFWPYGLRRAGSDPREFLTQLCSEFPFYLELGDGYESSVFQPSTALEERAARIENDEFAFILFARDATPLASQS